MKLSVYQSKKTSETQDRASIVKFTFPPLDDDDADPAQPKKSKGKGKGKGKAKTKAAAKSNAKAKAKASVSKSKTLVFNPVVALEATRKQYLFRPGLTFAESGESSKVFSFANHGGKAGASKAANKWLQDFKKSHTCK